MCYVMKAPFSSSPVLCLLMPVHVQCDHSVWLWVINNLSERKIQVKRPPSKPQSLPLSWNGRMTNLSDSGKNSLVTSVPPKLLHYSMLDHIGWKCQLWEKLVVNRCFVIDIRSYCFLKCVSLDFLLQRLWGISAGANSTLQLTTIRTVLELCEIVGREGLCSFNGRFNECVRCMAFTALFTFLDHMEILLHYILTKSSVWLGGRERRQESAPVLD